MTIGISRIDQNFYLKLKAFGRLTHEDYELIVPMVDEVLMEVKERRIRVLLDATELDDWDLRAAWDDLKLGIKYGSEFTKIAIVCDKPWDKALAKIAGWFISGKIKYFEKYFDATEWLQIDK